jgi:hypothetical protein
MTAVEDVLRRHGYSVSEQTLAAQLDALLSLSDRDSVGIDMSFADAVYLARYSGVHAASDADLAAMDAQSAARATAEAGRGLSRNDVAGLLAIDPSRVSHQIAAGRLYSYPGSQGRPVFPDWQFLAITDEQDASHPAPKASVIPHLAEVIAALPAGFHPVAVRTFITTSSPDLSVHGNALSPRDWLGGGGDPAAVVALAVTLGEQV